MDATRTRDGTSSYPNRSFTANRSDSAPGKSFGGFLGCSKLPAGQGRRDHRSNSSAQVRNRELSWRRII
jgi:hypothetical protein